VARMCTWPVALESPPKRDDHAGKSSAGTHGRRGPPLAPEAGRLPVGAWPDQPEHRKRSEARVSAGATTTRRRSCTPSG